MCFSDINETIRRQGRVRPNLSVAQDMSVSGDELLIRKIQRRLRGARGPEPNDQYVRVAVHLARDPALDANAVFNSAQPPITSGGGTRKRIQDWRDRILSEGLLDVCSQPAVDPAMALELEAGHRAKKAKQRAEQRQHWSALRDVVNSMVCHLESQHFSEALAPAAVTTAVPTATVAAAVSTCVSTI